MNPLKEKNSKGRSFKTLDGPRKGDGGGGKELSKRAKSTNRKGPNTGPGKDKQNPAKQRDRKTLVAMWCEGKGDCPR
jgi:hypothetical protein